MGRKTQQPIITDQLDGMLKRLQLTGIRDQLDNLLDEAARHDLSVAPGRGNGAFAMGGALARGFATPELHHFSGPDLAAKSVVPGSTGSDVLSGEPRFRHAHGSTGTWLGKRQANSPIGY
jgi:hypothetical protein